MDRKYDYFFVVQGYYFGRWEDEHFEDDAKDAKQSLRDYRLNMPERPHRIIRRRELRQIAA